MNSLESLINQIKGLPQTSEILSQRIALCRQALEQVDQKLQPILWAQLHVELGLRLCQMSNADRARHLEEAIAHFQEALTVYTRHDQAEVWAATTHNLATVYAERIREDRAENLEQAIRLYDQALEIRTQDAFPEDWASTQHNLANAYVQRIKGNQAENLEQAIALYRDALNVWTREKYPFDWARAQKGLGTAYFLRIRERRPDNLQKAITCFQKALTVWTRQAHPLSWADVQDGLGLVWRHLAGDDPAANVEQAITCHQAALEVWTREKDPWEWAMAQHNLGTAWHSRLQGNHAENQEKAIRCYQRALEVRTREAHPEAWAETIHNLATVYIELVSAESLEQAIKLYKQALEVRTRQALPMAWARTQSELGNANVCRIRGERATNLEWAIEYYTQALQIQSPETCPQDWATTQQNLAVAYSERLVEGRANNLRKAIVHYEQALRVFNKQSLMQWAMVQTDLVDTYWKLGNLELNIHYLQQAVTLCLEVVEALDPLPPSPRWALAHYNLGNAYGDLGRIGDNPGENQERAIKHYIQALKFYTPQEFPDRWANTHNNLAVTYWERQGGNRAENLLQAIHHFNRALEFSTPETFPANARRAARNLGNLHFGKRNWVEAHAAYEIALRAAEILYQASFMEAGRDVEIGENAALYIYDAFCLARIGRIPEGIERLEAGKTRTLSERLGRDAVQLQKASPGDRSEYLELVGRLKAMEARQRVSLITSDQVTLSGKHYLEIAEEVGQIEQELAALIKRIRQQVPDFLPTPLDFAAIQALLPDARTALTFLCVTEQGSAAFLVRQGAGAQVIWAEGFTHADLHRLLLETPPQVQSWLERYQGRKENPKAWKAALSEIGASQGEYRAGWQVAYQLQQITPDDHPARGSAWLAWLATIERVLAKMGLKLVAPLHAELQQRNLARLILIPQGSLFLLPLHAAPVGEDGACLLDCYEVSYVPSATVLQRCRERAAHARADGLFAVANPTCDLAYAGNEVRAIASLFSEPKTTLEQEQATKEATLTYAGEHGYVHFSCHGQYDWDEPSHSALLLAGSLVKDEAGRQTINYEHALTLSEVEAGLNLAQTRLVTLSACETGLTEAIGPRAEEYVGLPAGFLLAGAPAVVASLWAVDDLSTAMLMERFYLYHLHGDPDCPTRGPLPLAAALRRAQIWLSKATVDQIDDCLAEKHDRGDIEASQLIRSGQNHDDSLDDARPFKSPYYWAAFTISGAEATRKSDSRR